MVSICLSVLVQSCATYHVEFGLTLVGKPNRQKYIVGHFKCSWTVPSNEWTF